MQNENFAVQKEGARGLTLFSERLKHAHSAVDNIAKNLREIEGQLYAPKPSPIDSNEGAKIFGSIENGLNHLISRLNDLEKHTDSILHGR